MSVKLTCYFPAEKPLFLTATVHPDDYIVDLLAVVHQKLKDARQDVPLDELSLYLTDIPLEPREDLAQRSRQFLHEAEAAIDVSETVEDIFPHGPHGKKVLDILVATPEVLELLETIGNPDARFSRKIRTDLDQKFDKLSFGVAPSEAVSNAYNVKTLVDECRVYCNHIPVALFNRALANLQASLEKNDIAISPNDVDWANSYITYALRFYDTEALREAAIREFIDGSLKSDGQWREQLRWADGIKPGSHWSQGVFISTLLELKNTPGISGDPILQCIADYSKILPSDRYKKYRGTSNFPVVFIGIAGSRLRVSIAVYLGAIFVSDLVTVDLSRGFHGSDTVVRLARIFKGLTLCRQELKGYYDSIPASTRFDSSFLYPQPVSANEAELPAIKYDKYLCLDGSLTETVPDLDKRSTAVYTGTLAGKQVLIKFTPRYSSEAQVLLAGAGLAPDFISSNPIVGNLFMIVMEYINGAKSVQQLRAEGTPLPSIIFKEVKRGVSLLHGSNKVFGDLRDGNILCVKACPEDPTSKDRVALVDLDWPGIHGVDRYPATLNTQVAWAEDVRPYGIMRKDHDLWQLERLEKLCTLDVVTASGEE